MKRTNVLVAGVATAVMMALLLCGIAEGGGK